MVCRSFFDHVYTAFLTDLKNGIKSGMLTILAVMITLVLTNLTALFVLGTALATKTYPIVNIGRYISYSNFFENLESFIMAVWIIGTFVKISVFYYAAALSTAQWLNLSDYRPIVWPIGVLIAEFGFWAVLSSMVYERFISSTFPFYSVFIQTVFPLVL